MGIKLEKEELLAGIKSKGIKKISGCIGEYEEGHIVILGCVNTMKGLGYEEPSAMFNKSKEEEEREKENEKKREKEKNEKGKGK